MKKDIEENENTIAYRISELRKDRGWSQKELADQIHVAASQISRLESGETVNVSTDILVSAAKLFHVSADYLLGLTQITVPKSYDISQLNLSEKAVQRMICGNIDMDVLNRLMEHDRFPKLCSLIRFYFDDSLVEGIAARNEILDLAADPLAELKSTEPSKKAEILKDLRFLNSQKIGSNEADIEKIKNEFMRILRDIKTDIETQRPTTDTATAEAVQSIREALPDKPEGDVTVDDVSGAVAAYVGKVLPMDEGTSDLLKQLAKQMMEQSIPKKGNEK